MQFLYLENMDPELSKTVPIISPRPLVMIVGDFEIQENHPKNGVRGFQKNRHNFQDIGYITQSANQGGGGSLCSGFFEDFFTKNNISERPRGPRMP